MVAWREGARALVIGASGGIGGAFCAALEARSDVELILGSSRNRDNVPGAVASFVLDVTDPASIQSAGQAIRESTDRLDLVIYCVGVLHDPDHGVAPEKRLDDVDPIAMTRQFTINALAPLLLARELATLLPRRDPCVWANLSARVGSIGDNRFGGWYAYRGSKAAQNMFTRNLAIELGRRHRGLACIALHPGTVATNLSAPFRSAESEGVMTPEQAAGRMLKVMEALKPTDTGKFFAWDGREIPW
ncbi:MAG: SDR family oxidoreductase [Gammaproteobacteria bacterium]|nr:MAG: SDR family oxidoreductase [Gammaproteobacteria bacterium]